jgi:hypothetical protein
VQQYSRQMWVDGRYAFRSCQIMHEDAGHSAG